MNKIAHLLLCSVFLLPSISLAQSSCVTGYANATTNSSAIDRESAKHNFLFIKHCEKNGTVKSSSASQDLSVDVVSYVDIGFKGNQAEALQVMNQFCNAQAAENSSMDRYSSLTNTVVVAALNSFNQCIALERGGAYFSHVASTTGLEITGTLNEKLKQHQVQNVQYDPTAGTCDTTAMSAPKRTKVDRTTKAFTPKGTFTISCHRIGTKTQSGEIKFPRFEVIVATSQGPYQVTMLPESLLNYDLASENMRLLARADAQNTALKNEMAQKISAEQAKTAAAFNRRVTAYNYVIGDGWGVPCGYPGNAPTPQEHMKSVCGSRKLIEPTPESISLINRSGRCGVNAVSFACADN